ncbi:amidohydrolase [Acuticoccus sp. MNP-M23]|uniref:amidohydrolase n=1 Tax=Acuticoccus sp. MNP-M23 TaxID=3072793 RepID=UPI002815E531|nr:amidohydrolase [Acuticoccus sp. MNP-M23]WMS40929.1 amidohydrolase [Acuticoccus sp. MNP-M23]
MRPTLLSDVVLADGRNVDIRIESGRIAAITEASSTPPVTGDETHIECGGRLIAPSFCDGHIHLDKTFAGMPFVPHRRGTTVEARIEAEKEIRREMTVPVFDRGSHLLRRIIGLGTGTLRTHVDIDTEIGLANLHEVLALKEAFAEMVDMQVVAFPQSGILRDPGVADLLSAALEEGATHVGGLDPVGIDGDMNAPLDVVFALAERHGAGIDIHLHDGGGAGLAQLREIARRTREAGLSGQVVVSHAFALGDAHEIGPTVDALAAGGVAILTNGPGRALMPPVCALWEAGVPVLAGSDNIRDAWSPYGNGDMLKRAMVIGYRQGMNADDELALLFETITRHTPERLGFEARGIVDGADADLVVIDTTEVQDAVADHPARPLVMKRGRIVAENGVFAG